jgi:hypothetical protein
MFVYTLNDIVVYGSLAIIVLIGAIMTIRTAVKQRFCPHDTYRETMQCNAICRNCGKDLGFIQPWRERDRKRLEENKHREEK